MEKFNSSVSSRQHPLSATSHLDASRAFVSGLFIVRDLSSRYVREYFCLSHPLPFSSLRSVLYIISPARKSDTGRKRHRVIFYGEKSRKSREDPSTSSKKKGRGMKGQDEGREAAFYPGASLSPSELSRPGRATPVSRLSLDREKMSRPRQLGKIVSPPSSSPSLLSSSFPR